MQEVSVPGRARHPVLRRAHWRGAPAQERSSSFPFLAYHWRAGCFRRAGVPEPLPFAAASPIDPRLISFRQLMANDVQDSGGLPASSCSSPASGNMAFLSAVQLLVLACADQLLQPITAAQYVARCVFVPATSMQRRAIPSELSHTLYHTFHLLLQRAFLTSGREGKGA